MLFTATGAMELSSSGLLPPLRPPAARSPQQGDRVSDPRPPVVRSGAAGSPRPTRRPRHAGRGAACFRVCPPPPTNPRALPAATPALPPGDSKPTGRASPRHALVARVRAVSQTCHRQGAGDQAPH